MDISYFKDKICDELDGACEYIKDAIEHKSTNMAWAKQFADMSAVELGHATNLFKMFEDYFNGLVKDISEQSRAGMPWLDSSKKEIVDMYTEKYAKVRYMHELFNK